MTEIELRKMEPCPVCGSDGRAFINVSPTKHGCSEFPEKCGVVPTDPITWAAFPRIVKGGKELLNEMIGFALERDQGLEPLREKVLRAMVLPPAIEKQSEEADIVRLVTAVIRDADEMFVKSGGSSRHWVRECFLPKLNGAGLFIQPEITAEELHSRIVENTPMSISGEFGLTVDIVRDSLEELGVK